jgi:hypothetical protein
MALLNRLSKGRHPLSGRVIFTDSKSIRANVLKSAIASRQSAQDSKWLCVIARHPPTRLINNGELLP